MHVDKLMIYLEPAELLGVMDAIATTTAADLSPIAKGGNHQGRAIAAICKQWLKGRAK